MDEERLEFDENGAAIDLGEHEIDEAFAGKHLGEGLDAADLAGEGAEDFLGSGLGFRASYEVFDIPGERRVGELGDIGRIDLAESERDTFTVREAAEGGKDVGGAHVGARF
jgi:hypothetical protein